jgi:mRNA interferase YafQ
LFVLQYTAQFRKDLRRLKKRSQKNFKIVEKFLENMIVRGFEGVPQKFKPHKLIGNYKDCCECHVMNDLLLIWKEEAMDKTLVLIRIGTHSDLF